MRCIWEIRHLLKITNCKKETIVKYRTGAPILILSRLQKIVMLGYLSSLALTFFQRVPTNMDYSLNDFCNFSYSFY